MRAECNFRLGTSNGASPVDDINVLRTIRNKSNDASMNVNAAEISLDFILAERAIELYQENHRRQDLIRFGKYLEPKSNKTFTSLPKYLICPIPQSQMDMFPGFEQNPGY